MELDIKQLLLEQLKLSYPKTEIAFKKDTILIRDLPFKGMRTEILDRLDIYFGDFDLISNKALSTYLKPRLKYNDCRVFYNSGRLAIYLEKQFSKDKKGSFEKAMWAFDAIHYFTTKIRVLIEEILDENRKWIHRE